MMWTRKQHRQGISRGRVFIVLQALIVPMIVGVIVARSHSLPRSGSLPPTQTRPLVIPPKHDYAFVISDEQLATVLTRLRPPMPGVRPKINYVDHALRFWGVEAIFDNPECLSGEQMRELLVNHRVFAAAWGDETPSLLQQDENGVALRIQEGAATSSHVDHTLATLAEVGTPLDYPVTTADGRTNLAAVLHRALRKFSLNQSEYEWTTLACASYAPTLQSWVSREGQHVTYDRLARRIMRERAGRGCCYGNHRLYTLTILLRLDEEQPIFSMNVREEVQAYLQDMTRRLVQSQAVEGYWDERWPGFDARLQPDDFEPRTRRLLATGHALEWWAMAPPEFHPPREVLARGGQWLVSEISKMNDETIRDNYTFLTHVGRALALWRGDFPAALYARVKHLRPLTPTTRDATRERNSEPKKQRSGGAL